MGPEVMAMHEIWVGVVLPPLFRTRQTKSGDHVLVGYDEFLEPWCELYARCELCVDDKPLRQKKSRKCLYHHGQANV